MPEEMCLNPCVSVSVCVCVCMYVGEHVEEYSPASVWTCPCVGALHLPLFMLSACVLRISGDS